MIIFLRKKFLKQGQATSEYVTVLMFILLAFFIMQKYIVGALNGRWKGVGDSLGGGQIYDPRKTVECGVDSRFPDDWYEVKCFEEKCVPLCFGDGYSMSACEQCITSAETGCRCPD